MISEKLSSACKPRPDINGKDTVQTVWIDLNEDDLIVECIAEHGRHLTWKKLSLLSYQIRSLNQLALEKRF